MQGTPTIAAGLFGRLNEEGFEYCVLGDVRGYPGTICAPLELVVDSRTHHAFLELLKSFCDRNEMLLIEQCASPQCAAHLQLAWLDRQRRPEFLSVHVRHDYFRCGRRLWRAADLLAERAPAVGLAHDRDVFVAPPAKEFVRALLNSIDRNELTERDGEHLCLQWRLDPEGAALQAARFWDVGREGGIVLRAAVSGHWDPVRAARDALYSALAFHNVPAPAFWWRDLRRRAKRRAHPQGMMIACLGPDATCKSDVVQRLAQRPLPPFERSQVMHMRPEVMHPSPPVRQPGPREARGRLGTLAKLLLFAADYWVGYWLRTRPSLVRGTLLVSDRYFDDVLVNPRAYRMRRPRAFAKLVARWIPQPSLWLVFDAPATALPARGTQSSLSDLERLRREYRRVLRGRRHVVVLDASQSTEEVLAQAERAIAAQAARRSTRRLGLPADTVENPPAAKLLLFFCRRELPLLTRLVQTIFNSQIRCRTPSDIHLPNPYGLALHANAVIGRRVTVMQQVTIGGKEDALAPVIGDDVYIGAGARVLGDVRIGDRVVIGANAVVTRDVPAGSTVVGANRIIAGRLTLASKRDGAVAQLPVNAQRGGRR